MQKMRDSNIELLRIIAIIGVIILHYNNATMGGAFLYVEDGSVNYYILRVLESVFVCAVDLFVVITGFFLCRTDKRNVSKPIELLIQVGVFSAGLYLLRCINGGGISGRDLIFNFIPNNYFVILYVIVYLTSPYINILINALDYRKFSKMMALFIFLFACWPTGVDALGHFTRINWWGLSSINAFESQYGYTIVNFILCYMVGAWLYRKPKEKLKIQWLLLILLANTGAILIWSLFDEGTAWEYCNPLVILMAVTLFEIFRRIHVRSRILNCVAKAGISVYLLHTAFLPYIFISNFVNKTPIILVIHIVISSIVIYLACWVVHLVYGRIVAFVKWLFSLLLKTRVVR